VDRIYVLELWRPGRYPSTCVSRVGLLTRSGLRALLLLLCGWKPTSYWAFKAWWDRLAAGERTARSAFLHGLQRADAAWGAVYRQQGDALQKSRESLRAADKELGGMRAANERLRRELDQAVDRASEAEERVKRLTTPVTRDYE
jgi:hypothetical protein